MEWHIMQYKIGWANIWLWVMCCNKSNKGTFTNGINQADLWFRCMLRMRISQRSDLWAHCLSSSYFSFLTVYMHARCLDCRDEFFLALYDSFHPARRDEIWRWWNNLTFWLKFEVDWNLTLITYGNYIR